MQQFVMDAVTIHNFQNPSPLLNPLTSMSAEMGQSLVTQAQEHVH